MNLFLFTSSRAWSRPESSSPSPSALLALVGLAPPCDMKDLRKLALEELVVGRLRKAAASTREPS
eukprot:1752259-Pyramimonas_sp.AAC.1